MTSKIHSIQELADFLNCCTATAQKLKNSGKIPFIQFGRKLIIDPEQVSAALMQNDKTK